MPTYQYKREDGSTFEIIQKMSDEALKTCPKTGQKVKRIISGGGGVVYKGNGWYVTDYKNKSNDSSKDSGKKQGAGGASSSGNGAESKQPAKSREVAS
ncbi:zinc ribbon domain-containing protein [Balneolales bacterium ANBcel1]|nr:zinc ribbon domain-containing protein [Balneolales bacterium ANBcel1]